jgi:hypothetical protein
MSAVAEIKEQLSKLNENEKSQHRVAFLHFCQSAVVSTSLVILLPLNKIMVNIY